MENFKIGCKYIRAQLVRGFYFLTLLILSVPANAQNNGLSFEHLSTKDGLPFSTINDIYQDNKGFIWIATFNGLFRYDGYNFKTFTTKPDDVQSLTDNWIACLFVDSEGVLYAGTSEQGLNIYNSQKEQFIRHHAAPGANALGSDRIRSIKEDQKGIIWIGTADKGFYSFDKKSNKFTSYTLPASCANNCIDMVVDRDNNIWMVTSLLEVVTFNPATNEFTINHSFPGKQIDEVQTKLIIDSEDNLWIGANPSGLFCYNIKANTTQHWTQDSNAPKRLTSYHITDILRANDGNIWVATDGGGIDVLNIETGEISHNQSNENNPAGLSTNAVYCLYSDNTNTIWAGTYLGGINIFNPQKKKFSIYRPDSNSAFGLTSNSVLSIYEDQDHDLLIGTDGSGLYLYNREKQGEEFIDLKVDIDGKSNTCPRVVRTVLQTSDRTIWLGSYDSGLVRFDKKTRRVSHLGWDANNREKISGPTVWSMMEDDHNHLWLGVWRNGIDIYNWKTNKVVKKYNQANGFKGDLVSHIFKDKKNRIWVATFDAGINRYTPETDSFDNYRHDPKISTGLSSNIVSCIFEDSNGGIWAGTIGGGLNRYDETTDNFYAIADRVDFMSNEIAGILEDKDGNLWISTYKGISRYSPGTNKLKNYDANDGLQGYIFNDGATFKASDGAFYFGGTKGFNAFYPEQIQDSPDQTPLYITSFSLFNKLVSVNSRDSILKQSIIETKEIILPYDKTDLMFEFIAINYQSAKKNEYAYILDNFDKEWNFVGTKRFATYTNLNPGEYLLKVKATNNDGIWNEVPTTIQITITPPFWQRWWFITLLVLVTIRVLIFIFQWRNRHLLRQKNELAQKVKESTKDLELANKNLQERQEEVLQQSEELKATLHQLSTAQNKLIQSEKMASLGILAAGVAHEINNPLNYIMGAQSGLADYFKEHGSGDGKKTDFFQNSILAGVERISGIINGLDQFSRNNDQLDEDCNIHSILDNCLIMLNNKLEKKADIEKDYCADPILIKGNVGKLHHVFINILDNSIHAIVEKGKIKIHTSTSAKYVLIIIEDNGIGIDEKYLSKITDPFFTTNAPGEGTGLGLAITYSIIKDHMGSLEYQSEVNKGTRAIIKLPIE